MTIFKFIFLALAGTGSIALALPAYGQNSELARARDSNFNNGYSLAPAEAGSLQGSPFLLPAWSAATLRLAAGERVVSAPLKYDVYRQELRVRRPQGDSVVLPLAQVREFSLTGTTPARRFVCYPPTSLPAEVSGAAAEVLFEGANAQLLKFVRKEVVKKTIDSGSYATTTTISVLDEQTHYYLRWSPSGQLVGLRLKRASLEQALAGRPAALAALKSRKGSLGSEVELVAAVAALDPLLAPAGH
ncbi:hypothetical protein [Hymenobacter baengnokdamensis]|uniref:hypothetical protein n=1 Tax=Hymenobacter baengnokdamensis TaxID=2615203 RepID=UPI0012485F18|nr:hypothetical protein [Hymenobacter baengnokdamensis]